uniref:methionine--tRNA ligase n=1 Tax=Chromera velia CCMP2878 TaxID=1169474 RepID=A0A0G4HK54_9ALVE|mmetsp:Transcript_29148/g.57143  ORF Transcript_29148/g.57143 Transcript_29148/m.57143 type:complete len:636 (+) Transcript_29148:233-2140(+)|eukprot:Cvel_7165.t1-p1 / transcript=Cvel_7165.t1 / gene=Cvel_7165 / organism=Chromera_velia_CCMP2878 / gene_product=Methionine--tRNA ligase, putative / transcript_product=Methionine--tRNA ligase, putative / location=Cvel_scaffold368:86856-91373(+) / protein_length=635 / sequence_SO=supercontig / SO=protein_coding / is_pseudo=false
MRSNVPLILLLQTSSALSFLLRHPKAPRGFKSSHRQEAKHWVEGPCALRSAVSESSLRDPSPFFITTPIYYVNDKPHIGHAYTTVACDALARFARLDGRDVLFLTGTDEHGKKVEESAQRMSMTPQELCDSVSVRFSRLSEAMNCSADDFIRTTEERHKKAVNAMWRRLEERGQIYLGTYEGWYSVRDETYYSDSELVDGRAPTGAEVVKVEKEKSYFFRLSEWGDRLLHLYEERPDFILPYQRRNEVIAFVNKGLRDVSVSRTIEGGFSWGVRVPTDPEHVIYVWIDALTNYLSALGFPDEDAGKFKAFWPPACHVVGKDILRFHAILWPAMLMAAGLELPQRVFAHGWWTRNGEKMSKSLGNVVDPFEMVEAVGSDQLRFFLLTEVSFGNDGDFSQESMRRSMMVLSNEVGNLVNRVVTLLNKQAGGLVPPLKKSQGDDAEEDIEERDLDQSSRDLLEQCDALLPKLREDAAQQAPHKYAHEVVTLARHANKYLEDSAPWKVFKTDPSAARNTLFVAAEAARRIGIALQPLTPTAAEKILDQLGVPGTKEERSLQSIEPSQRLPVGTPVGKAEPVFPRIEDETQQKKSESGKASSEKQQKQQKKKKKKGKQKTDAQEGEGTDGAQPAPQSAAA